MSNEKKELELPAMSPEKDGDLLHKIQVDNINAALKDKSTSELSTPCTWCGENEWITHPAVFTRTLFDVNKDKHVHSKVSPYIAIMCKNCGNEMTFNLRAFGLTTKAYIDKE